MTGSKRNSILILISSLLLGSSLSLIVTRFLIEKFGLNFLSLQMPGVSEKLAFEKTFDILDFGVAGVLAAIFFAVNWLGYKFILSGFKKAESTFAPILLLIFSVITFLQTHFLTFATSRILVMIAVFEVLFFLLVGFNRAFDLSILGSELKKPEGKIRFQNGIFLGFVLLLLTNWFLAIPILSLFWLFLTPLLTLASTNKRFNSYLENFPGFLLIAAILFPTNFTQILGLLIICVVLSIATLKLKKGILLKNWITYFLNPVLIIFLIAFNPLFTLGNFDTIEEGFWLAWIQRLINGEVLYRDVAVYHSPLIPWGMYLFSKVSGFSIYSERLFLHLLQISGFVIFFFFARKLIKSTFFASLSLFLFLAVTASLVRNNIEIRLGLSLLSLLFLFIFFEKRKLWALISAGVIGAVSLLTSLESGIAVLITLVLGLNIFSETKFLSWEKLKENLFLIIGIFTPLLLFAGYLLLNSAFFQFFEQTSFYAKAFSLGYFNSAMDRAAVHSYFQFDLFDHYLDSPGVFWEITKLVFIGFLIYWVFLFFSRDKINFETRQVLTTAFFGLILTRAALGRSDWYHLLFVLGIAFILICYALAKLYLTHRLLTFGLILFLTFFMLRPSVNHAFFNRQFSKFQTYGQVIGDYKAYYFERGAGALMPMEVDTQPLFELVEYIQLNSTKENSIFVFPWNPEIYFYTDRKNSTQFDTPYAFFTEHYQDEMVRQLRENRPKYIIYNNTMTFGGLTQDSLRKVNEFIANEYGKEKSFGLYDVLVKKN